MRLLKSFRYAFEGIRYCFRTQSNFRIHVLGFIFMNLSAFYFHFVTWEYILCLLISALVFFAELMNTAIESAVDLNTQEMHPLAKSAKDCASGAVLVLATCAVIIWGILIKGKLCL